MVLSETPNSHFNTSHVTVYLYSDKSAAYPVADFNTSHVTVYRCLGLDLISVQNYFNTSHVTVYPGQVNFKANTLTIFQYIPCYGLSKKKKRGTLVIIYFNTSHVTVYQFHYNHTDLLFHHFNTSHVTVYQEEFDIIHYHGLFQYIPCYGLSNDFKPFLSWHLSSFPLFYVISAFFTSRL